MIAEATIREALDASRDQLLGDAPRTVVIDPRSCTSEFIPISKAPPAGSLFEACVEAIGFCKADSRDGFTDENCAIITRAVIQTLIDRTESPTTCAELTRILAGVV